MYYTSFGLCHPPFKITPDTRLFFAGGNRGAVLEALVYAIVSGEGIVKVVGEVGSGKTMLCRMLEVELPENVEIVYLANPSLSPDHILHAIAFELKLPVEGTDDRLRVMHALQDYLVRKHAENRRVVAFVEEAQSMPIETLEEIRLLSNLETQDDKLLQIVLFGQPELDASLAEPRIRQLKERITYSFYLSPFSTDEVRNYVESRLRISGYRGVGLFTQGAIRAISRSSKGLTRRINILADKALLAAFADNAVKVATRHVRRAARDSEFAADRVHDARTVALGWCLLFMAAVPVGIFANHAFQSGTGAVSAPALSDLSSDNVVEGGNNALDISGHSDGAMPGSTAAAGPHSGDIGDVIGEARTSPEAGKTPVATKRVQRAPRRDKGTTRRPQGDVAGTLLGNAK